MKNKIKRGKRNFTRIGLKVLCVTDLGEVKITDFRSEVLTLGVPDKDGNPVLVTPEIDMPKGGKLY
ncbi:t-RNA-binding domain protein [Candidatus Haloredivivus sp. G17]|nr:t-RNA-binding domain protein [Candidatus Haloredivivus sp. G17]